ncbi:MAG: protein-glutamate O-methyltransferase CheR [Acidobacteriota bacterium]
MPISPAQTAFVQALVHKRAAIVLDPSKQYLLETRLGALAAEQGFPCADELIKASRDRLPLQSQIIEALTTNETSFFRDLRPFECLREAVLPGLIRARAARRELRIWSAACSTGQEPYSLSMMIHEHFPELCTWPVRILATDIAAHVLARAKAGRYRTLEVNRGLPAQMLVKYFDRDGVDWEIKPTIKRLVEFSALNLVGPWPATLRPDIVLLRNVLIYFDLPTKRKILERIRGQIAPDGLLLLGAAETVLSIDDAWERVPFEKTAYYRLRDGGKVTV